MTNGRVSLCVVASIGPAGLKHVVVVLCPDELDLLFCAVSLQCSGLNHVHNIARLVGVFCLIDKKILLLFSC